MLSRSPCVGPTACLTEQCTLYGKERAGGGAGGEDAQKRDDARETRRNGSAHLNGALPPALALRALREALASVVSEPVVREYLQTEHPALYEQLDEAMRLATGLRAVEHAAAERDRRLAHLDEADRLLVRQGLEEWASGRVAYLAAPGRPSGAYWYATAAGMVEVPWSRRVARLLSHEELVRWSGLPEVPKAGEVD
jgi:hypothetical protein